MKHLITGANGFIGQHLCNYLQERHIPFRALVRQQQNFPEAYICPDLLNFNSWPHLFKDVNTVIHLAAKVHDMTMPSLEEYILTNVQLTIKLAQEAKKNRVKRFIFISTIKVNGELTTDQPFTAENIPNPQDPYAASKLKAENDLMCLHESGVFEVVIIRPPLIYGAGVKANFQSLIKLIKTRIPLPFGAIHNKRSFISVYNLVDLIYICAVHPKAAGQIFLASDGADISTTTLIRSLSKALNIKLILIPIPFKILNFFVRLLNLTDYGQRLFSNLQVNIDKTKTVLQWTPPYTLDESLSRMFRGDRHIEKA